jgi:osmotically-inducible protein OsmY
MNAPLQCELFKKIKMKTDEALQKDVQNAIQWEPDLSTTAIDVNAKEGVVTLTGNVDSYAKKQAVEVAAKNVKGVKVVVEKIDILLSGIAGNKADNEIADEILESLKWAWEVPKDKVTITVENGRITLEGELEWHYQQEALEKAVSKQAGVKSIADNITIKNVSKDTVEKKDIENALERDWSIDTARIKVEVTCNKVILNGTVDSFYQKDKAERIAWNAPGVWNVANELVIE